MIGQKTKSYCRSCRRTFLYIYNGRERKVCDNCKVYKNFDYEKLKLNLNKDYKAKHLNVIRDCLRDLNSAQIQNNPDHTAPGWYFLAASILKGRTVLLIDSLETRREEETKNK
jgi:hypothetical protein